MKAFGAMTFGGQTDEIEARRLVDAALDAGITHFDTANVYNEGRSEEILGRCLKGRKATIATKVGGRYATEKEGLGGEHVVKSCDASLKRLGVEHVEIYYMHMPDPAVPIEETLGAMENLVRAGKVARLGASNFAAWQVVRMLPAVTVVQPMYSLLARDIEREFLPMCREFQLETLVYNPLAGGLLTGKHKPGTPTKGTRFDVTPMYQKRYWLEPMFRAVEEYAVIARAAGKTLLQLALQWVKAQDVGILLGASKLEQLKECLAALEGALDPATLKACDEVYSRLAGPIPKYNR